MKKMFLFLLFSSLFLTYSYSQNLRFEQTQSDNISFPLDVGNKFFYMGGRDPDDGYYGSIKEIIDTLADGTRKISVTNYYNSSTSNTTEYWQFSDNKLFVGSSYPITTTVFNGYLTNDTCTSFQPSICYELFDSTIFNQYNSCQAFVQGYFNPSGGTTYKTFTANKIGVYFKWYNSFSFVPPFNEVKDSTTLIGYTKSGILIGDSILTDISDLNQLNYRYELNQNYPNPFNPITTIRYQLPERSIVALKIFDILGREAATLVNEEKPAGSFEVQFNASGLTSGIYFYQLKAGDPSTGSRQVYSETKKMSLLR